MTTTPSVALSSAATPAQTAVSDGLIVARVTTLSNSATPAVFLPKTDSEAWITPGTLGSTAEGPG